MSKLITASIDVTKINKAKLVKGEKGIYLNLTMWLNDEPDEYGNHMSVQQSQSKEEREANEPKNYLGNGKVMTSGPKEPEPPSEEDMGDLPF